MILGIDPGHIQSAYVVYQPETEEILEHGISENEKFLYEEIQLLCKPEGCLIVAAIEMIASYGMPVGKEIFETVFYIGRLWERLEIAKELVYRKDIKLHICGTNRAKDSNIRQALIDRLGSPGTKKVKGKTYGLKGDEWSALAVAIFWADRKGGPSW